MEPFIYHAQYRVIICPLCQYAVIPSEIDAHLANTKHRTPRTKRRVIQADIVARSNMIQTREQLQDELINSPARSSPHSRFTHKSRRSRMHIP